MTFPRALVNSISIRLLWGLLLLVVSEHVLALGCTGSYTYTDNGGSTSYTLSSGQSLKINSGTYTGNINDFPTNSSICVESGASFKPSNLNGATGSLINYGSADLATFSYNAGTLIDNYGFLKFTSGMNFNGAATIKNNTNATVVTTNSFTLSNSSLLENNGLFIAGQDFSTNTGTTVTNHYRLEVEGNFNPSGILNNYGRIYAKSFINANSDFSFNNYCTLVSYSGFNNNSLFFSNWGTILVTSANGVPGGLWQNNQSFYNGNEAKVAGGDFTNNGQVTGYGGLIFSGETRNQGLFTGSSAASPISFYDESQTGVFFFDFYNSLATNTLRSLFARPTELDAPTTCHVSYKSFAALNVCPAGGAIQNQTSFATQASGNGAAVENAIQAIGLLQAVNTTATVSNSATISSGGVLTLDLGQVVPTDSPILLSLAQLNSAARVKVEVSLDEAVFSNKGTFGNNGTLGTSPLNLLSRVVINANPGGTRYVRLTYEAGSMWVDGAEYSQSCFESRDYGDAPASYGNVSHQLSTNNLYLGSIIPDAETTSSYSIRANGDGADEDGPPPQAAGSSIPQFAVLQMTDMSYSTTIRTTNQTGSAAKLSGWIDFDKSGSFDADERASVEVPTGSNNTNTTLTWTSIPTDIKLGTTYVRLRLTTAASAALQPTGDAPNGEVEDFILPVQMDIPPNSPSLSVTNGASPLACQTIIFEDSFNDLTPSETTFWAANRASAATIRSWTSSGGGTDSYARFMDWGLGYGTSIYFGNGSVRNISPNLGNGFSFNAQGKLLTQIDALALRDTIDDLDPTAATTTVRESHWGVQPVTLSRSFTTAVGKTYRLYFSALRETGDYLPGIMRVDAPGGSIHFKAPGGTEGVLNYAIDFTATSTTSSISFVNYGHFGPNSSDYCNVLNNAWCTVGGLDNNGKSANELSIDNVKLVEAACSVGAIGGYTYQDANLNNTYDMGTESTISAITVQLYDEKGTPTDTSDDRLVATAATVADGHYLFSNLDATLSYRVMADAADVDLPAGLSIGTANPLTGLVPLVGGIKTVNFGFDPASSNNLKDYGDAPASYNAPQHTITPGFYLGTDAPDSESVQASPLNGTGDDVSGLDDEGGVTIPFLVQGQAATIIVPVLGANAYLQTWIDWNGDGDFADSGEQVATNIQDNLAGDTNNTANLIAFTVNVPATATSSGTYARFRWSTLANLNSSASATDGEVEDYALSISSVSSIPTIVGEYRFDDCGSGGWQLDSSGNNNAVIGVPQIQTENYKNYACTALSNPNWNLEVPHQANYALTSGAVSILFYDHKGVWSSARLLDKGWTAAQKLSLDMKPTTDWQHGTVAVNLNGNVIDTGETYYTSLGNGSLNDSQWVHAVLSFGPAGMKLYINGVLKGINAYTGGIEGVQGNFRLPGVEGYFDEFYIFNQQPTDAQVSILYSNLLANKTWNGNTRSCSCGGGTSVDYGDAPTSYGEVSHKIISSLYLGDNPPDAETASKSSFNARADNYDDGAPQQNALGVYIPLFPVLQLTDASYLVGFKVTNTTGTAGKLYGWIDFDKSGTFEADEAAVVDVPSGSSHAMVTLNWTTLPLDIQLGTVALRVRLTTDTSVSASTPTGSANDGEVEDYPIAIAMDIPPNSPSLAIISGATPAACEAVVFQDHFNDLTPGIFWGMNRPNSQAIRDWDRLGGGNDTYAHITSNSATDHSVYFGNGGVRQISPSIGAGFSFDANGKLLTVIDAIALRDDMDDIITPGTTANEYGSKADWGPEPVRFSRSFATVEGKSYRLYFKARPEDPAGIYVSGIMRLDMPGGSIHFKAPGSAEGVQSYAVEFTAVSSSSTISFVNYGHVENDGSNYCDPNSVFNNNVWCTVGGRSDGKAANELIIDDVILTEVACATGSIRGYVYIDSDQDDIFAAGIESGVSAISLKLYDENATPSDFSDDRLVNTTTSYVNGGYYFTELNTNRTYRLEVDTSDSDLPSHTALGTSNPLLSRTVTANTLLDNQNFGFDIFTPSKIVGTVYIDNNTNNSFEVGSDYGIGYITVSLYTMAGTLVATTETAINGKYQFANLDHNLSYQITADITDADLPPGAMLGTLNPIPNITVPQNSTVTQDIGFDQAASGITGKVFLDYNLNGQLDTQSAMSNFANNMNIGLAFDKGIANAQIKAECVGAAGKLNFGPVTSDVNGQYYLATPGAVAGNYNCIVQLTTVPSGYTVATQSGSGHQVLTQVVSPNAANTYFALQQEASYCQNNPDLAVNRFAYGQQTPNSPFAGNNDVANIFAFPYNSGTVGVPNTLPLGYNHPLETDAAFKDLALANQVGSVFGLGWHPNSQSLFASAYMKAWTGFGAGGTGGIYRVDLTNPSNPTSSLYANLNQIFPATPATAGSDPYLTGIFSTTNPGYVQIADGSSAQDGSYVASGNTTRDNQNGQIAAAVGVTAFGDLDVSADGKSLFVVNMATNKLYILPVRTSPLTAADAGLISSYAIPFASNCRVNGTKRAFGLGEYEGGLYVATECGTEQGQLWEVPEHAIFRFDLSSKTFSTTPSLVYARASEDSYGIDFSLITDLVFDSTGQMILTFRNALESPYGTTADNGKGTAYSVIRRACIQNKASYQWQKENNASCGGVTTAGKDIGYGSGPGSGAFFHQEYPADNGPALRSASYGGAAQIPGFMEMAYTIAEPFEFYSVGISWVDTGLGNPTTAGQRNRAYSFYQGTGAFEYPDNRPINGKNAAIGDLEVLCDSPALEIGNRVWQDTDGNGIQDAGEVPITGVKVELFANGANLATATPLATAVTDSNGYYLFSSDLRGYPITGNNAPNNITGVNGGFNATDIQGGRASSASHKYGLINLLPNLQYQVVIRNITGASKQAVLSTMTLTTALQGADTERDSNGLVTAEHAVANVAILDYGNHNHAVDFGFALAAQPLHQILGKVWFDTNNDGIQNDGITAFIEGSKVELYNPTTASIVAFTSTNSNGEFQFTSTNGMQASSNYQLRIHKFDTNAPLTNWSLTAANAGSDDSLDSDASLSSNYWVINIISPASGSTVSGYGFGFTNTVATGCLDIGSSGISNESISNAHSNAYDFLFGSTQVTGYCAEQADQDPQTSDSYTVNASDRQSLTVLTKEKISRGYSALTDPDIVFQIAAVFGSGNNQARLDDLMRYITWFYTNWTESLVSMDAQIDSNNNYSIAQQAAMKGLARIVIDRINGVNGQTQYPLQTIFWLWNTTSSSRQDIIVPAMYIIGASCSSGKTISGKVFEDINYGGGIGRASSAIGVVGVNAATVELYSASGNFIRSTSTDTAGIYTFSNMSTDNYFVRVVNSSVKSTRTGSDGTERGIQTFRTDGSVAVSNEVGGRVPASLDAASNTTGQSLNTTSFTLSGGGQAQSVQAVTLSNTLSGVDFGFNFDTIVNTNNSGQGSLRQFILNANLLGAEASLAQAGLTAGLENSIFMIPGAGPHIIIPTSALPNLTGTATALNAATQNGASCAVSSRTLKIGLDGSSAGVNTSGLTIDAANVVVRGFAIGKFTDAGILGTANADSLSVVCNNLGLAPDGSNLSANGTHGLSVKAGASTLQVGGSTANDRNIISGNNRDGVHLEGVATATIMHNYIGTDVDGSNARSNNREGASYAGVSASLSSSALTVRNNLISGNDMIAGAGPIYNVSSGIWLDGVATATITGNLIGTNLTGTMALRNTGYGIYTKTATDIMIGGVTAAERNIISANFKDAINTRFGTNRITILGNYLGTDITGAASLGNTDNGIFLADTQGAVIGNSTTAGRNIIAGNKLSGIRNTNSSGTIMTGNYLGLDSSGTVELGNQLHGIYVQTSANVRIGGSAVSDRNVIAANKVIGVFLVGAASNTRVENNIVGLKADGNTDAGNLQAGIETSATSGVTLHNNVIAANKTRGIHLVTSPNTTITNNFIGLNSAGTLDRGNTVHGIDIENGVAGLSISNNTIAGNGGNGVFVITTGTNSKIFSNSNLNANKIGLAADGLTAIANDGAGIWIESSAGLVVGGGVSTDANLIAYNKGDGITIIGASANQNTVNHNRIYANTGLGIDLNNDGVTLNDNVDADFGYANDNLNFPMLQQIILANGNLILRGCAPAGSFVELFEADVSPSGAATVGANRFGRTLDYGEGQYYLGSFVEGTVADADAGSCAMPTTDGNNNTGMKAFQFSIPAPASVVSGDYLTATATLAVAGTSEFGPTAPVIEGPPPIGAGSCAATGGSDILFIVDNSGSITEMEYADFAQTIQTVGSQLLLDNPQNRIAIAHFGGPSDSLVGGGQYVYIERDFSSAAMSAPVRQFAWGGAYNMSWIADHLAGAIQQMRYALDGQAGTTSSYILSPVKETARNTASPLQVVLMTDAARYLDNVPSDISMLIDPPGSGAEPDDGSVFTVYNQMKAEGVSFSVVSFNADPTDIATSAAIASVGGAYNGAIESNTQDPDGSQATPRRYVSVTSGFQLTTAQVDELVEGTAICSSSIQGRIFEDPNYGGGVGRPFGTVGTVGIAGATIEVYDASGHYAAGVESTTDGKYTLPNLPDATYYVRVVDNTVSSSRAGSNAAEVPVLTYRSDGKVATPNQIGGNQPTLVDAGINSGAATLNTNTFLFTGGSLTGKPAQSVQAVVLAGSSLKEVDFGFNFSTIVNTNDAGQGSLRQFLLNNKQLATASLAQNLPAALAAEYPAGTETAIFMIPSTQLTANKAIIHLSSGALSLERANTSIDGRTQLANIGSGVIVLEGSTTDGLSVLATATASAVRDLTINNAAGSGLVLDGVHQARIERVSLLNNHQYGISLSNDVLNNQLLTNTIAHNTWAGIVHVGNGVGNTYSRNSIYDNGGLGIDLASNGVTANDANDSDSGPNNLLNYPEVELGSSISSNGTKVVAYDFDLDVSNNTQGYRVEFFRNTTADTSKHGEGEIYLGYVDLNHAGGGTLNFKGSLNANQVVPADANIAVTLTEKTSPTTLGSTSEFSGVRNGSVSVCTDLINGTGADMTVNENALVITYLEATDANGNPITYVISGGADGYQFMVQDPTPGTTIDCQLVVFRKPDIVVGARSTAISKAAPVLIPGNYEIPTDSGGDNTYELTITAMVNNQAYVRSLSVGVQDINELPAMISAELTEVLEGKTGVVVDIESYDPDAGDGEGKGLGYAISGGADRSRFKINAQTGELSFIETPDFEVPLDAGNDNVYDLDVRVMDDQGLSSVSSLKIAVTDDKLNDGLLLQTKVLLQGPYVADTGLMQDSLRALGILPISQPYTAKPFNYTGTEQLNLDLATITGKNAIVDWVLVELRDPTNPQTVLASKAALVQRDGDVIDAATGSSSLNFKIAAGNYSVSLRHRNHLGVRTATTIALGSTAAMVDFSHTSTTIAGQFARLESASLALLWSGDVNHDERLIVSGIASDSSEIFNAVLKAPSNTNLNSSYRLNGYLESDVNMDGTTLFMGPSNDTNVLLGNVILFPSNKDKNSNYIAVGSLAK